MVRIIELYGYLCSGRPPQSADVLLLFFLFSFLLAALSGLVETAAVAHFQKPSCGVPMGRVVRKNTIIIVGARTMQYNAAKLTTALIRALSPTISFAHSTMHYELAVSILYELALSTSITIFHVLLSTVLNSNAVLLNLSLSCRSC